MKWDPNKPDCPDCNEPPCDAWAHAHDPYGRRCMPRCDSCSEKHIEEQRAHDAFLEQQRMTWPDCHKCGDPLAPGPHFCANDPARRHDETIRGRVL